jgi:hypothetical protein
MDRKTLTIILGSSLIGCFFLPFFKDGLVNISAYDMVFTTPGNNESDRYLWLLIPVSGTLLLTGALNNEKYIPNRGILAWLPLLTLVFFIIRLYMRQNRIDHAAGLESFARIFAIGFWITLGMALLLAFARPKAS